MGGLDTSAALVFIDTADELAKFFSLWDVEEGPPVVAEELDA